MIQRELSLLRYGILGWFSPDAPADQRATFTCYKESDWGVFLVGALMMLGFESIAVQVFLRQTHPWIAHVHTGLALYGVLWLLGDYQALKKSLICLTPSALSVQIGMRQEFSIPYDSIVRVELGEPKELDRPVEIRMGKFVSEPKLAGYQVVAVMGKPTVNLTLAKPITLRGWLGRRTSPDRIGLGVDAPGEFLNALRSRMAK